MVIKKIEYIGSEIFRESKYLNRVIRPGQKFSIKEVAAKELLKSKLWRDCDRKATTNEKSK